MKLDEKFLFGEYWGGYATAIQIPSHKAFIIPPTLNLKESPPLMCAGVTVFTAIMNTATPKSRVAVAGIGGLGHLAL